MTNNQTKSKYFRHSTISTVPSNTASATFNGSQSLTEQSNKSSKQKPNLKFKRISSIRRVNLACDENLSDSENTDKESLVRRNTLQASSLMMFGSSPVSSDYDSDRLQKELEHLKKSRKMYGAQWLLSSPNLLTIHSEEAAKDKELSNLNSIL